MSPAHRLWCARCSVGAALAWGLLRLVVRMGRDPDATTTKVLAFLAAMIVLIPISLATCQRPVRRP